MTRTTKRASRAQRKPPSMPAGGSERTYELIRVASHMRAVLDDLFRSIDEFITSDPMPAIEPTELSSGGEPVAFIGGAPLPRLARKLSVAERTERVKSLCETAHRFEQIKGPKGMTSPFSNVLADLEFLEPTIEAYHATANEKQGSESRELARELCAFACAIVRARQSVPKSPRERVARIVSILQEVAARRSDGWPENQGETVESVATSIDAELARVRTDIGRVLAASMRELVIAAA